MTQIRSAPISAADDGVTPRRIVYRTRGHAHGPISRLMSPGDLGEHLKPFVFLDHFQTQAAAPVKFGAHPHSGIATLTTFLEGGATYADSTGQSGVLTAGSVEWMRAGRGVWHTGAPVPGQVMRGYQLWLALPQALELAEPESLYLDPARIVSEGPARVLLGAYRGKSGPIPLPVSITYLHVRLQAGEPWTYQPGEDHDVAWLAVNRGRLKAGDLVLEDELAMFEEGQGAIDLVADGPTEFVIGSAAKHPHPLVKGSYSVHTSAQALAEGEGRIVELRTTPQVIALDQSR
jgi:redox-sensitive bicupin YhaK (pirin superfamily)